jgi:cytochrome P450
MCRIFSVAGSDTTATTIRATFLHIIASPQIYSTLRKEIDSSVAGSTPSIITDAEARKLPYLQAVIIEGLRFWPPIGLLASKIVPRGGATINGFFLPEGVSIGVSTMGIQRSKDIFGQDADQYRPERWLSFGNSDEEKARERKMRSTVDLVFASGKYTCPGRPVAMMELNKIFVEVGFEFFCLTSSGA